jgi:D-inositol-3-phosphate glycosyltransferase
MNERAPKVAMISMHGDPAAELGADGAGGQNVYVKETAVALGRHNVSVDVFTRRERKNAPEVEFIGDRARVIRLLAGEIRHIHRDRLNLYMGAFAEAICAFIKKDGLSYTALHTHYWHSGWSGLRVCSRFGFTHFHTSHSLGAIKYQHVSAPQSADIRLTVERDILKRCNYIVATCPHEEASIRQYYSPHSRIVVLPCGVNTTHFQPSLKEDSRRAIGLEASGPVVLFVGRFDERKGLQTLLKAMASLRNELPKSGPAPQLLVIGGTTADGEDKREYEQILENVVQLGLTDLVRFFGRVPHERLRAYYTAADLVVVPSHYEPFGLVAVEAMACGVPVIASKVGGLQYSIEDGQTGILVPPRQPLTLASAMRDLLDNHELCQQMRRNGVERVRKYFNWSDVGDKLLELYLRGTLVDSPKAL